MGRLYDGCQKISDYIDRNGLDVFKTRGAVAMKTGFLITLVTPDDPDDPAKIQSLKDAAREVLGIELDI